MNPLTPADVVRVYRCPANQRLTATGKGAIVTQGPDKCLGIAGPGTVWGSRVEIAPCDGSRNRRRTVRNVA